MERTPSLSALRKYAIARSLFPLTSLRRAVARLGFVQADPIRAPARAQDLILRHRVRNYRISDLERQYPKLDVEEDYFVNYGFMPRELSALLHPRAVSTTLSAKTRRQMERMLQTIQESGELHPRTAAIHDKDGRITNYWGGASRTTTHLLDRLHFGGVLRILRRDNGIRIYAKSNHVLIEDERRTRQVRADALISLIVDLYAPLPAESIAPLALMLRSGLPILGRELAAAVARVRAEFPHSKSAGTLWYWPPGEDPHRQVSDPPSIVRLLAPFDPVVWDRRRFERFWGWAYRFEAYLPAVKRQRGYYALPLLWRDRIVGWGNVSLANGQVVADIGYVGGTAPKERQFRRELDAEIERLASFLTR